VLAAAHRLRRRVDFTETVRAGRRASRGSVVVHLVSIPASLPANVAAANVDEPARAEQLPARAGFVVSRAVGGAVVRNQVKRRLRHLVRDRLADLPAGARLVVRALPSATGRSYQELGSDLEAALAAALRPRSR
jgi:ribonuclease P protein component